MTRTHTTLSCRAGDSAGMNRRRISRPIRAVAPHRGPHRTGLTGPRDDARRSRIALRVVFGVLPHPPDDPNHLANPRHHS